MKKTNAPFRRTVVEYYEEISDADGSPILANRRVRVVTKDEKWIGWKDDPVTTTKFEYL